MGVLWVFAAFCGWGLGFRVRGFWGLFGYACSGVLGLFGWVVGGFLRCLNGLFEGCLGCLDGLFGGFGDGVAGKGLAGLLD